ncbi:MAG: helix-turn-helix domain-containing protein [Solimonas sp.]
MGAARSLPLGALRAFDAAAQLGSFRAAAYLIGLTPSAVSQQPVAGGTR